MYLIYVKLLKNQKIFTDKMKFGDVVFTGSIDYSGRQKLALTHVSFTWENHYNRFLE